MLEPDAGRDLDSVLERYAEIPIGIYHTVGADALPIETITGGGRGADVMSRRRQPEAQIQRAIVQHYRARAADGVFMFAVPNGGFRRPIEAAILKATGTVAGVPDTIWVKGGQVYALELKIAGGRPTEAQLATIAKMEAAGAFCCIADGLDRALAVLEAWGLLQGRAS
jgi:hypothetical protein